MNPPIKLKQRSGHSPRKPLRVTFMDMWKALEELGAEDPNLGEDPHGGAHSSEATARVAASNPGAQHSEATRPSDTTLRGTASVKGADTKEVPS